MIENLTSTRDFSGVASVVKALSVLEFVGTSDGGASAAGARTLADIAAHTKMPKSTLLRLLSTLIDAGFLVRTKHNSYAVGLKLWRIGCSAVSYESVRDNVNPVLRELMDQTLETTHYAVYESGYSVYVEKVDGSHPIRAYTSVGGRSPAYASATGKVLLAWRGDEEIARVAANARPFTGSTITDPAALAAEMLRVRETGYAVNRGEWSTEVSGIAAPVFGRADEVVAAIGVSGPRDRIEPNIEAFAANVLKAAEQLSVMHGALKRSAVGVNKHGCA